MISNDVPIEGHLSKMNMEKCKQSIAKKEYGKLITACGQFLFANLKEMEELSKQWMVLFLLNVDILAQEELKNIRKKFSVNFGKDTFKVLFLKELLFICQEQQEDEKHILLITKASKMFSEKILQDIGREVSLGWAVLFAKHVQKLDNNCLG
ncbi:MAG: hypothetical protein H0U27_13440, partial [Nitrosopumilus sp.]|nr:hypothetical protein [Nitrosopumilus sp.]